MELGCTQLVVPVGLNKEFHKVGAVPGDCFLKEWTVSEQETTRYLDFLVSRTGSSDMNRVRFLDFRKVSSGQRYFRTVATV